MRRKTALFLVTMSASLLAFGASAGPVVDDDDDNPPQQSAPPAASPPAASALAPVPAPAPAPLPVTIPAPVPTPRPAVNSATIAPISPIGPSSAGPSNAGPSSGPVAQQPVVTPTGATSAIITMSPSATAPSPSSPYGAPLPALPAAPAPVLPPDPKIAELNAGIDQLRMAFSQHIQQAGLLHQQRSSIALGYYRATGDINSRLSTGAVPEDQILLGDQQHAQQLLETLQGNTDQLNGLSTSLTDDASSVLALAQQIRIQLDIPGKSASDRAGFAGVERKISAAQAEIDQSLRNVLGELARENKSIGVERQKLVVIAREIRTGALESDRAIGLRGGEADDDPGPTPAALAVGSGARPLVVITGDVVGQSYERQLYAAVSAILKRSPGASFTVQATTPGGATGARRALDASDAQHKADDVVRSLSTFGLPRTRIIETESSDEALSQPEVQVFSGAGSR